MEPSLVKKHITSVLPILTHVRDRVFYFCRILVGFPRSSEKPPVIAQIFNPLKPSGALGHWRQQNRTHLIAPEACSYHLLRDILTTSLRSVTCDVVVLAAVLHLFHSLNTLAC